MKIILIFKPKGNKVNYDEQYLRIAYYEFDSLDVDVFNFTKFPVNWKRYYCNGF